MTSIRSATNRSSSMSKNADTERFFLIGRIASGLAHELNGPIGIALGFSELARESLAKAGDSGLDAEGIKKVNEYLGLVENAGLRARTLARQIWSFAKAEPGKISDFDLAEAVESAAALAAPAVKVGQIEIGRRGDEPVPSLVTGDPALLAQALVRLFLDSVKSLPQGGNVYWEMNGSADGQQQFTLSAEPWGEVSSATWPVDESIKDAFRSQDGSISDSVARPVEASEMSPAPTSPGWYVTASLPKAAGN